MIEDDGADITVSVPAVGGVSANYPLSALQSTDRAEQVTQLAHWFEEHADVITDAFRRPTATNATLPAELSDQLLIEAYNNQFRVPGSTTFVRDISGSLAGECLTLL